MKDGVVSVACLGAGYFSQFHYDAWARLPQAICVGAADHDIARAEATGLPAFDGLDAMLNDACPDILDIILPPPAHRKAILTALDFGVKTIICQKPFCMDLAEAEGITHLAEHAGATLIVHENFRFMPWYRVIQAQIEAGRIGTPLQATFRLRPGDGQGPDAYLDRQPYFQQMPRFLIHETGVHWVDTFRFIFGSPRAVYADLRQINPVISGEDAGFVIFEHAEGVRSLLDGNRLCDHAAENHRKTMGEAEFEGTAGAFELRGDGSVTFRAHGQMQREVVLPPDASPSFGGDCVYHLQDHVVRGVLTGAPFENTAREYLEVIRIKDAIYASHQAGCKVDLPSV